jgi:signal transduction histidine kinase/ActR/RegA family two-component response regulator
VVIALITGLIVGDMRLREERSARAQLLSLSTLLADQTARAVESVELVVSDVADDLSQAGINTPDRFEALRDDPAVFERLRARVANIPQLEAVTLDSSRGKLINSSRFLPVPDVDITDRDYFQFLVGHPSEMTTISAPVKNRGSGTWNIYLARRINATSGGAEGALVGLVLGAMRLEYFQQLYDNISQAGNIRICLWRSDGTLLARYPRTPLVGTRVGGGQRASLLGQTPGGTMIRADFPGSDGRLLMIAAHKLSRNGLVVEVSETMDDVLADWRHDSLVVGVSGLACIGAAILLMLALMRQFRTYAAMMEAVSAREEAVAARQQAEQRLLEGQKMEAIGRLTSGLAHDFNNLLGSISGNLELLQRDKLIGATSTRRLSVIQQAADRGAGLIRQLLAFSGQQVLAPAPVELDVAFDRMAELLEGTVGGDIRLVVDVEPGVWKVMVDPAQFEYMLLNLAVNARDAMPAGGTLTLSARRVPAQSLAPSLPPSLTQSGAWLGAQTHAGYARADVRPEGLGVGDFVAVSVSDTGTGMPPDVVRKAFDPFFTTKPPGRGSGLGLSQVYGLATQSGGLAQVHSALGFGTTVTVFLPRAVIGGGEAIARPHILLAEDDADMRESLGGLLRDQGFEVTEAADGAQALALLEGGLRPRILLADQNMPGLSGVALGRLVRERCAAVTVVLMSGNVAAPDLDGDWVIQKPFASQSLVQLLEKAVAGEDNRRSGEALTSALGLSQNGK